MAVKIGKFVTLHRSNIPNIFQYAYKKKNEGIFNDVTIKVANQEFPANRLVLSCCSEVFEKILLSEMKEKYEKVVEIKAVDANDMKKILDFMYTGSITIDDETNAINLLSAAEYLQLNELKEFCSEYLEAIITSDNCFVMVNVADLYGCDRLKEKSNQYISSNLRHFASTMDFKNLTKHQLKSCFSNLDQTQASYTSIYESLITWIKHDQQSRRDEVDELLQFVEFSKFTGDYLNDIVLNETLITDSKQFPVIAKKLLAEGNKRDKMKPYESKILVSGSHGKENVILEIFNHFHNSPTKYPDLPESAAGDHMVKLFNNIFCVVENSASRCHVWKMKLNETNLKWEKAASTNFERRSFSVARFQNHIVVAGGYGKNKRTVPTEVYSVAFDEWKSISLLQTQRSSHCLVECRESLYALGGWDNSLVYLSSVERLTGMKSKWSFVKPMQTARHSFAAVSLNGYIYAIGGYVGLMFFTALKSVEKYDPITNEWSYVQDMNTEKKFLAACVLQGKIYIVGGLDSNSRYIKEIEYYDPTTNIWTIVEQIDHELRGHCLVVV